ncbi:hypothetical protein D3C84_810270 [compost metagenome]
MTPFITTSGGGVSVWAMTTDVTDTAEIMVMARHSCTGLLFNSFMRCLLKQKLGLHHD